MIKMKNSNQKFKILIIICLIVLVSAILLFTSDKNYVRAGDGSKIYWVSPTDTAIWANCESANDPGASYCSLSTANSNASAGDTVYLKGGTYSYTSLYATALKPANSGVAGNWIVFKNALGETPEIKGTYGTRMWGLFIEGRSYIQIDGIIFTDFTDHLIRNSAHHIEVKNSTFRNVTSPYRGGSFQMVEACMGGGGYRCYVSDIWVHHNTFYKLAGGGGCSGSTISEGGDPVRIGYYSLTCSQGICTEGLNTNITIEDNYMAYGGHVVMDSYSIRSVFKNNVAHNEPWYPADNGACNVSYEPVYSNAAYNGLYSHRVWSFTDTFSRDYSFNLIEANRLGYGGVNPNNDGATGLTISSPGNIIRYNASYGAMHNAMKTKYGANYGWQASGGINNRIYNNTLYKNGYGYPYFQTCTIQQLSTCPKPLRGFRWYAPADNPGNVLINNIVYGSYGAVVRGLDDIQDNTSGSLAFNNFCTNADTKCTAYGDPLFINPDLTQTTSKILPDLTLQTNSAAINGGTNLTQANGAGSNSTTLVVDDALYFQDATWGAAMAKGVTLFPDWIAIGSISNVVQINSINYSTNTVTLASPMTWSDNSPIWLYKNSSGQQVLYGSAPDYGAYEYAEAAPPPDTTPPAAPTGVTIL